MGGFIEPGPRKYRFAIHTSILPIVRDFHERRKASLLSSAHRGSVNCCSLKEDYLLLRCRLTPQLPIDRTVLPSSYRAARKKHTFCLHRKHLSQPDG
jgi:hypothetical protein